MITIIVIKRFCGNWKRVWHVINIPLWLNWIWLNLFLSWIMSWISRRITFERTCSPFWRISDNYSSSILFHGRSDKSIDNCAWLHRISKNLYCYPKCSICYWKNDTGGTLNNTIIAHDALARPDVLANVLFTTAFLIYAQINLIPFLK